MSLLDRHFTAPGAVPFHEADDARRAALLRVLADTLLYLALTGDPRDDAAELARLPLEGGGEAALACDDDGDLAGMLGRPVAHLALPGREAARMLAAEGLALLVNPGAPSAMLLDPDALGWLASALAAAPAAEEMRLTDLAAPDPAVVAALAPALGARLADMPGLADSATLVAARDGAGRPLHLILLNSPADAAAEAAAAARPALAKAVAELIAFLPPLPVPVDVSFAAPPLPPGAVTIRLEAEAAPPAPAAPPAEPKPPRLR